MEGSSDTKGVAQEGDREDGKRSMAIRKMKLVSESLMNKISPKWIFTHLYLDC